VQTLQSETVLTPQEAQRLRELEEIITNGFDTFLRVGIAFAEVRFSRLYRESHDTFESYCRARWGLSLSRTNQIISTVRVVENITNAFPGDAALLEAANESTLRPLSRIEPELQVAAWELVRRIKAEPDAAVIKEVVTTIRSAIETGWRDREQSSSANGKHGTNGQRQRQSDALGNLCRWSNRITSWDPAAIAQADDELRLKRHLKAAHALRTFCDAFIQALETRLAK
jgi:hypothetical protein